MIQKPFPIVFLVQILVEYRRTTTASMVREGFDDDYHLVGIISVNVVDHDDDVREWWRNVDEQSPYTAHIRIAHVHSSNHMSVLQEIITRLIQTGSTM